MKKGSIFKLNPFFVYNLSMRVVVLGKGLMLANIVLGVLDAGADVVGVFRYEETCNSRLKMLFDDFFKPAPEVTLINKLKIRQIRLKSANGPLFRKLMVTLNVDLIIIGTWRERLEKETFNLPTIASVNVHPSLLPKYRGPNPYLQSILHGEKYSGVTLHLVTEKFDNGPILKQEKVEILDSDTSQELRDRSVRTARKLVTELISDLDNKVLTPVAQNEKLATYYPNISGDERMLDFKFQISDEISRTIRALHPFLPCYITYLNKFFIVNPYNFKILQESFSANAGDIVAKNPEKSSITILCADDKAIRFTDLKLYKAERKTKEFIKSEVVVI